MTAIHTRRILCALAGLAMGLTIAVPAWAAFGAPPMQVLTGKVQNIDYLHHAITVNGQTYAVAANARFRGVAGFSVLHLGMPIAYTLGSASPTGQQADTPPPANADNPATPTQEAGPAVITSITWLPGGD